MRPRVGRAAAVPPRPVAFVIDLTAPWTDPRRPDSPPTSHLQWAEHIARLIARIKPFYWAYRSQEADDLVAVAHLTLVALAARFDAARVRPGGDPNQLFRGWAHRHFPKECLREAERLRNGGTYRTTDDKAAKGAVGKIPERCPSCAVVMGWGAGPAPDPGEGDEAEDVNAWLAAHGYGP